MPDLNNLSVEQLQDIYFKEYGYEPSMTKSKEVLLKDLEGYRPVSLKDFDLM